MPEGEEVGQEEDRREADVDGCAGILVVRSPGQRRNRVSKAMKI